MKEIYEGLEKKPFEIHPEMEEEQQSVSFSVEEFEQQYKFGQKSEQEIAAQVSKLKNNLLAERMDSIRNEFQNTRLLNVPGNTALMGEFKSTFSARVSDKKRAAAMTNKRSRLFKKKQNASMIEKKAKEVMDSNFAMLKYNMRDSLPFDDEAIMDISAFMDTEYIEDNRELVKNYFGTGVKREGQNVVKALDFMTKVLMAEDAFDIRLENDKAIAENAARLERLTNRVAAFDRLAGKHGYLDTLDADMRNTVEKKLNRLRSIANYYTIKKEIINDPLYQKSYNDELSMDFTSTDDLEKQMLAKKLLKAYVFGKNMLDKNLAIDELNAVKSPRFKNQKDGDAFIKKQQDIIALKGEDEILQKSYILKDVKKYTDDINLSNKIAQKQLTDTALKNIEEYRGEWFSQPDYKDEGYDETKVLGYFDELSKMDLSDIKFSSYKEMILHFSENYAICEKADRLWYEIARALAHGYKNEAIDDKTLIEIRAKGNAYMSIKNTLKIVNNRLATEPESAGYDEKKWNEIIIETLAIENVGLHNRPEIHPACCGNPEAVLLKYRQTAIEENDTKEQSIKEAYPYILGNLNEEIPKQELEKRKLSYNANAIIHDYLNQMGYFTDKVPDVSATKTTLLKSPDDKRIPCPRIFAAMIQGKTAAETERLYKLANGSPQEVIKYCEEALHEVYSMAMNEFKYKYDGSLLDNWHKKNKIAKIVANFNDIGNYIEKLITKNPNMDLKLPDIYNSIEEMMKDAKIMFHVGCALISPHASGYAQLPSNRWIHGFSMEEIGSLNKEKHLQKETLKDDLSNAELNTFNNVMTKILIQMSFINTSHDFEPDGVYNIHTDIEEIYKKTQQKYDEEHKK